MKSRQRVNQIVTPHYAQTPHLTISHTSAGACSFFSLDYSSLERLQRLWKAMNEYARNNVYFSKPKKFRQKINHFLGVKLYEISDLLSSSINDNFEMLKPAS